MKCKRGRSTFWGVTTHFLGKLMGHDSYLYEINGSLLIFWLETSKILQKNILIIVPWTSFHIRPCWLFVSNEWCFKITKSWSRSLHVNNFSFLPQSVPKGVIKCHKSNLVSCKAFCYCLCSMNLFARIPCAHLIPRAQSIISYLRCVNQLT